jgi:hypothetical protein
MVLVANIVVYVGSKWEYTHTEMERSENWGEDLYIEEYLLSIWLYSLNYAVPTLGIYREEYYRLVEMSKPWNWWLINRVRYTGESEFHLNEYIALMYNIFIHRVFMVQTLYYYHHNNHSNQPISPTPTSLVF